MSVRFKDVARRGKCDVCGRETDVVTCCSMFGAFSFAYCEDCLGADAEPYGAMVEYIACAGRFPDDINEEYRDLVRRILNYLGKTEAEFIRDVDNAIRMDMEACQSGCVAEERNAEDDFGQVTDENR